MYHVCSKNTIPSRHKQGRPQVDAAALGLALLGAPRHGVWVDYSFFPDAPCAGEFSRNAI